MLSYDEAIPLRQRHEPRGLTPETLTLHDVMPQRPPIDPETHA